MAHLPFPICINTEHDRIDCWQAALPFNAWCQPCKDKWWRECSDKDTDRMSYDEIVAREA